MPSRQCLHCFLNLVAKDSGPKQQPAAGFTALGHAHPSMSTLHSESCSERFWSRADGPASPASPRQNTTQLHARHSAMPTRQGLTLLSEFCKERLWNHAAGPASPPPRQKSIRLQVSLCLARPTRQCPTLLSESCRKLKDQITPQGNFFQ